MNSSSFRMPGARRVLLIAVLASWPLWPVAAPTVAQGEATEPPTLVLPDGGRYFGPLQAGLLHGVGRIEWAGGSQYSGEFVRGRMHGRGRLVGTGYVYEGEFADGAMRGPGRMTYASGLIVEGSFDGYQPVGPATVISPKGARYEGALQNQVPTGQGVMTLEDKTVVRGEFSQGEVDGRGEIRYPDGATYTGDVQGNSAHGDGELRYANGDVYRGRFGLGKPDGKGRLARAGASVQHGYWRAGAYIGTQGDGTVDETPGLAARNNETALYNQQALLQKQWAALKPSRPDAVEMYALFVAGDGSQEVFRREVSYVDDLFARRFDTRGRSISLVNSRSSTAQLPLATAHSIELSLKALARTMDRERDLLFVFLSSHGSRNHELSLGMNGMALADLPAARLGALLKASGIRNQVIVVSACYSGGFIPALRGERTWVITAARADRSSFGCADENDFTYFGRALFKESLPDAPSLSAAVAKAIRQVETWEARDMGPDDAARSEPQSVVAPAFRAEVDDWFAARSAARAH